MKAIHLTALMIVIGFASCNQEGQAEKQKNTKKYYSTIAFTRKKMDIGEVVLGTTREIEFYAINRSDVPLIIDSVKSSCSCTVSQFPKLPIMKNDSGLIVAKYTPNSSNIGALDKSVVVLSNTKPAFSVLTFTGSVVAPIAKN